MMMLGDINYDDSIVGWIIMRRRALLARGDEGK